MKAITLLALGSIVSGCVLAETKTAMASLPAAVQKTIKDETKTATLVNISKEKEKGKTVYELETKVNGKTRDLMIDGVGAIYLVEQEVDLSDIPVAARNAIQRKVGSSKLKKVETVTRGADVFYEAAYTAKLGKGKEVTVNADGSDHK